MQTDGPLYDAIWDGDPRQQDANRLANKYTPAHFPAHFPKDDPRLPVGPAPDYAPIRRGRFDFLKGLI